MIMMIKTCFNKNVLYYDDVFQNIFLFCCAVKIVQPVALCETKQLSIYDHHSIFLFILSICQSFCNAYLPLNITLTVIEQSRPTPYFKGTRQRSNSPSLSLSLNSFRVVNQCITIHVFFCINFIFMCRDALFYISTVQPFLG